MDTKMMILKKKGIFGVNKGVNNWMDNWIMAGDQSVICQNREKGLRTTDQSGYVR